MIRFRRALLPALALLAAAAGCSAPVGAAREIPMAEHTANDTGDRIVKTDDEWRRTLDLDAYAVLRQKGTERAFTGKYWDNHAKGTYVCAACGNPLFSSDAKFESGTGWPSFWQPLDRAKSVDTHEDDSLFMRRTEVVCHRCGGHLGHLFDDGPEPTGLRYCMNSAALKFEPAR